MTQLTTEVRHLPQAEPRPGSSVRIDPVDLQQSTYGESFERLWSRHGYLLRQFTRRAFQQTYSGSALGLAWAIVTPLVMMALYTFVFSVVFQNRYGVMPGESRLDYAFGVFLSITTFGVFSDAFGSAPTAISGQPNFVRKVVFPLAILPLAQVLASGIRYGLTMVLLVVAVVVSGRVLPATAAWAPVLMASVLLMTAGLAWLFSAVGVYLRDISQVASTLSLALFWASAVFFSLERVPDGFRQVMALNPILQAIELLRGALLWGVSPADRPGGLAVLAIGSLGLFFGGFWTFRRLQPAFADVV